MAMLFAAIPLDAPNMKDSTVVPLDDHPNINNGDAPDVSETEKQSQSEIDSDTRIRRARFTSLAIFGFTILLGIFEASMIPLLSRGKNRDQIGWIIASSLWSALGQVAFFGATLLAREHYYILIATVSNVVTAIISYVILVGTHYHWIAVPLAHTKDAYAGVITILGYIILLTPLVGNLFAISITMPYGKHTKADFFLSTTGAKRTKLVVALFVIMACFEAGAVVVVGWALAPLVAIMAGSVLVHSTIVAFFIIHFLTNEEGVNPLYMLLDVANMFTLLASIAVVVYLVVAH